MSDTRNIADRTEQELIQCILEIYSKDEVACLAISQHIAEKLTQRRTIIRERRKKVAQQPMSNSRGGGGR